MKEKVMIFISIGTRVRVRGGRVESGQVEQNVLVGVGVMVALARSR